MNNVETVLNAAMALPKSDRLQLIESLLANDDDMADDIDEVAASWLEVSRKRAAEIKGGTVKTIPWEQVRLEIQRIVHGRVSS